MASTCPIHREWIIVNDGSTDESGDVLQRLQAQYGYRLIEQRPGQGKGAALIRGFGEAKGDIIIVQDADFEYDPNEIASVIQPLLDGKADVVYGSRFKKSGFQIHHTYHYFGNRLLTFLSNLLSG